MKSFLSFLKEEWYQSYKVQSMQEPLEIYKNPSRKEITQLAKQDFGAFRAFLMDDGNMYAWSRAIHGQAHKSLKLGANMIPVYVEIFAQTGMIKVTDFINNSNWGDHREKVAGKIRSNRHLNKLFNKLKIEYYNQRSSGDWETE